MNPQVLFLGASMLLSLARASAAAIEPVSLLMPDGQMRSQLLRVYVSADVQASDRPELTLLAGRFLRQNPPDWTERPVRPTELARFQHWTETRDGVGIARTGTLLLFDLRDAGPTLTPCTQVTPILRWGQPQQTAISDKPVYIGNLSAAVVLAFLFVGSAAAVVVFWASRAENPDRRMPPGWKRLLLNPQCRLSLSKTQAAFWTLCVTGMVVCIGLTRLEVPAIPESLVALMGLSLATRAAIFVTEQNGETSCRARDHGTPPVQPKPTLSDLIHSGQPTGNPVAITKAQMVVWTGVAGVLFLVKSLLNGELWEVPWQLVALMGISQASYLIPPIHEKWERDRKRAEARAQLENARRSAEGT